MTSVLYKKGHVHTGVKMGTGTRRPSRTPEAAANLQGTGQGVK